MKMKLNPFLVQKLYTDANGECGYTIPEIKDEMDNVTVYFEYLGSTTVSYNYTFRNDTILPKWSCNFENIDLPNVIRFGQTISFDMKFWCPENSSISFDGMPVIFSFTYGVKIESYSQYIAGDNTLLLSYKIANNFDGDLHVTIKFIGSNQISSSSHNIKIDIEGKIKPILEFIEIPKSQYLIGSYYFSVKATAKNDTIGVAAGDIYFLEDIMIIYEILDSSGKVIHINNDTTDVNGISSVTLSFEEIGDDFTIRIKVIEEGIHAGSVITTENIRIVDAFIIFLDLLPYILILVGIITSALFAVYRGIIIPKRIKERNLYKQMYQKLSDIENIQYVIILDKNSGIPVFSKNLANVPIDEVLISGFLSAVSSFGAKIGSKIKDTGGGLEELSYRQFKIVLDEGDYVKVALLLLKKPSITLKEKLNKFNSIFEEINKERLIEFNGVQFDDIPMTQLIEEIFQADLLYPHQLIESKILNYISNLSKKDLTRKIIVTARSNEYESNFYLRDIINHLRANGIEEIKSFQRLEKIKNDKVIFAINPRTNYLIEELKPYFVMLDSDDRNVLFAMFNGASNEMEIRKYLKKRRISLNNEIDKILEKLENIGIIKEDKNITETGSAIATILKLIPDL